MTVKDIHLEYSPSGAVRVSQRGVEQLKEIFVELVSKYGSVSTMDENWLEYSISHWEELIVSHWLQYPNSIGLKAEIVEDINGVEHPCCLSFDRPGRLIKMSQKDGIATMH